MFSHFRATCSISFTVSIFSLGFPLASPLLISRLSIFSQLEKVTGFTPTEEKKINKISHLAVDVFTTTELQREGDGVVAIRCDDIAGIRDGVVK